MTPTHPRILPGYLSAIHLAVTCLLFVRMFANERPAAWVAVNSSAGFKITFENPLLIPCSAIHK